jgi:hypothetical protein
MGFPPAQGNTSAFSNRDALGWSDHGRPRRLLDGCGDVE